MPKVVRIDGVGNVEFPDSMDDAAISSAIETDILTRPRIAKRVPGTVANIAAARLSRDKNTSIVDTRPPIGSDVSAWDVAKAAGSGLLSALPLADPSSADSLGTQMASKVGTDMATELSRGNSPQTSMRRTVLRAVPVVGDIAARLTSPATAYMSGRAPSRDENLDVVQATSQLGGTLIGGKLASDSLPRSSPAPIPRSPSKINLLRPLPTAATMEPAAPAPARLPLPDVWDGSSPSGTMPVYGEPTSVPPGRPARMLEYMVREAASKIPAVGTRVSDAVKGTIARPKTVTPQVGTMDLSKPAAFGSARLEPIRPRTTSEFDIRNPTVFRGSTEDTSLSPPPVGDDFAFGDAPAQPLNPFKPRAVGPDFDPRAAGGKFAPRASIPLATDVPTKSAGVPVTTSRGKGVSTHQFTNPRSGQLMHRVRLGDGTTTVVPASTLAPAPTTVPASTRVPQASWLSPTANEPIPATAAATTPTVHPDVQQMMSDPKGPMILGQIAQSPHATSILSTIPAGSKIIGHGYEGVVLETPGVPTITRIARVTAGAERPALPEVLQPLSTKKFGNWSVEQLPRVTMGATPEEAAQLKAKLADKGYDLYDIHDQAAIDSNLGRTADGRLVVIDGGAVIKSQPITGKDNGIGGGYQYGPNRDDEADFARRGTGGKIVHENDALVAKTPYWDLLPQSWSNARRALGTSPIDGGNPKERGWSGRPLPSMSPTLLPASDAATNRTESPNTIVTNKAGSKNPFIILHEYGHRGIEDGDLTDAQREELVGLRKKYEAKYMAPAEQAWSNYEDRWVEQQKAQDPLTRHLGVDPKSYREMLARTEKQFIDPAKAKMPAAWVDLSRGESQHSGLPSLLASYVMDPSEMKRRFPDVYDYVKKLYGGKEFIQRKPPK